MRKQTKNLKAIYQETEVEIETLLWYSRKDWALKDGHVSLFMTKLWSSNQEIFCKNKTIKAVSLKPKSFFKV